MNSAELICRQGSGITPQSQRKDTTFHLAAERGYTVAVQTLIEAGVNMNMLDRNGRTPLHLAVLRSSVKLTRAVIKAGVDLNVRDDCGRTPLIEAIVKGYTAVAKVLIHAGADVNISSKDKKTPLHFAVFRGNVDIVKALLEAGANVNAKEEREGNTPLSLASLQDCSDVTKVLLEAGADIRIQNKNNMTPLRLSVKTKDSNIDQIGTHIAKLNAAGLNRGQANLTGWEKFLYFPYLHNMSHMPPVYVQEIKRMKEENEPFYDFLIESDINELVSILEKDEGMLRCSLNAQEYLKTQFPNYSYLLIDKANRVKKEVFLHNHKPLVDFLSEHYKADIQAMTFPGIKNFFEFHRSDFMKELGGSEKLTLIDFVDFSDIVVRSVPKLKVIGFGESIKSYTRFSQQQQLSAMPVQPQSGRADQPQYSSAETADESTSSRESMGEKAEDISGCSRSEGIRTRKQKRKQEEEQKGKKKKLFKDLPAKTEDFENASELKDLPLKFCGYRWLENSRKYKYLSRNSLNNYNKRIQMKK